MTCRTTNHACPNPAADPRVGADSPATMEATLVRAAVAGDQHALCELFQANVASVRALVWPLVRVDVEMDDILQEVWLELARSIRHFEYRASFKTWLLTIGRRVAYDAHRRRVRHYPPWLPLVQTLSVDSAVIAHLDLERATARIPRSYLRVLIAHDVEGYTHLEIARRLGIATGTSKVMLHRARRACRAALVIDGDY